MKDLDINDIWESGNEEAMQHFLSIPNPEDKAKQRSKQSLKKMKRNMINETLIALPFLIGANFYFYYTDKNMFWGYLGVSLFAIALTIFTALRIRKKAKLAQGKNVRSALQLYINFFEAVLRRTKTLISVYTPLAMCLMMIMIVAEDMQYWDLSKKMLILGFIIIAAIFTSIIIIVGINRFYIPEVYGKHLEDLKNTYAGLISSNGN